MAKISTADVRNFLVNDPWVQQFVKDRYDPTDCDDPTYKAELTKIQAGGANPKKWKRLGKFKVGSKIDIDGSTGAMGVGGLNYAENPAYAGGVVRVMELADTDHITLAVLELNGQLSIIDDLSD